MLKKVLQKIFQKCTAFKSNNLQNSNKVLCNQISVRQKEAQKETPRTMCTNQIQTWHWCSSRHVSQLPAMWNAMKSVLQSHCSWYVSVMHSSLPADWCKHSLLQVVSEFNCFLTHKLHNSIQVKWFTLNQDVNSQNNRWLTDPYKILMLFTKGLDCKVTVWCMFTNPKQCVQFTKDEKSTDIPHRTLLQSTQLITPWQPLCCLSRSIFWRCQTWIFYSSAHLNNCTLNQAEGKYAANNWIQLDCMESLL